MDAFEHCRDLVAQHNKERHWANLYAPADNRDALYALYAFDHSIVHIAKVVKEPMAGEIRLQWWRDVLDGLRREDAASHPVAAALMQTTANYQLPIARLTTLLDAHSADLYDDAFDPERYGVETWGAIYALAAKILGREGEPVEYISRHAGAAEAWTLAQRPDEARHHREAAAKLLPDVPEAILPALLPAATLCKRDLPSWRRQWLVWRAARDPARIFA